jgi:predicted TIM-barrel fold metal-dependent hydrolase
MTVDRPLTETCLPPHATPQPPAWPLPPGACDCHAHVLGPFDRHPLAAERSYTPPASLPDAYLRMLDALGFARGVLVQPSIYGTDNRCVLDTVSAHGERLRAVVVVDPAIAPDELARMHAAGARGFRINLLFKGGVALDALEATARKVAPLGWHAQLLVDIRSLGDFAARLDALPIPVVFDHMGHFPAALGTEWDGFRAMLRLAERGNAWVKISGAYRLSDRRSPHAEVAPIARRLIAAVPERLVWGTDWPHVARFDWMPDTGALLNEFLGWCDDDGARQRILADNPRALYGFR